MTDTGEADARLAAALRAWDDEPGPQARAEVLAALAGARVFVCLAARPEGEAVEMALLSMVRTDGTSVLPVFSAGRAVQAWRREARPVPVSGPEACQTAHDGGSSGLVLDPTGAALVLDADEVARLARGWVPVAGTPMAARRTTEQLTAPAAAPDPGLVSALGQALAGEPVRSAQLLQGPDGLVVGVDADLDAAGLAALAQRVLRRLGPALPADGLDVAVVAPDGPGHAIPLPAAARRGWFRRR